MAVYVLDRQGRLLMPCTEKRARLLLERGRARVHRVVPFVIRLVYRLVGESACQPLALKIDPGSKVTGMALVRTEGKRMAALSLMELVHRGAAIRKALQQRSVFRRRRRTTDLRHRAPRFDNRARPEGWLPPSLQHRVDGTLSWVERIRRCAPVQSLAVERVKFDMQLMQTPEISGVEYQQGDLAGYEVREYLLEKWGRACVYCAAPNVPLQVEHIHPCSQGGSHRVSNLTLSCGKCNEKKGTLPIEQFLKKKPDLLARLERKTKAPLRDAAAVNATRNTLFFALLNTGLPVATGTGGQTKFNRHRLGLPKTHALDAVCVGEVAAVTIGQQPTMQIKATGRGEYQRTRLTAYGFPRAYLTRQKRHFGFQTGDMVKAIVPKGRKTGTHVGRVAIRKTGSFNVQTGVAVVQGIGHRHCHLIQRADGYGYTFIQTTDSTTKTEEARTGSGAA